MKTQTIKPDDLIVKTLTASIMDVGKQFQISARNQKRDVAYLEKRFAAEGRGFVTKTLPQFGKHFDLALQSGKFLPFPAFKRGKGSLPSFLKGLTDKVFNENGTLLDNPCTDAIRALRTLSFLYYKVEGDYPKELVDACITDFIAVDQNLEECDKLEPEQMGLIYHASKVIGEIFKGFDPLDITPRPGPGQTAERREHSQRYEPHTKYDVLHAVYPYYDYFYCKGIHITDSWRRYLTLPRAKSGISRLATVPKDSRGPRIICMEPHEYMWFQQGLGRAMQKHIARHWMTKGQVNFDDQSVNGKLALESSLTGAYCTLDMKEASDRISRNLVELLFDEVPELQKRLLALATDWIELPNGEFLRKKKYAPMGSALCFPVMSIVHFALSIAAMKVCNEGRTYADFADGIFVYGDDLIVRAEYTEIIMECFPSLGLKFNPTKCCIHGKFRESCGVDAYNGVDVTPLRIKGDTFSRKDPTALPKALSIFHGLFNRGLWGAARIWQELIDDTWGKLPCVTKTSAALGWIVPRSELVKANTPLLKPIKKPKPFPRDFLGCKAWFTPSALPKDFSKSFLRVPAKKTLKPHYQAPEVRARMIIPRPHASMRGGWEQLMRFFTHSEIVSTNLSRRAHIKLVWADFTLSTL